MSDIAEKKSAMMSDDKKFALVPKVVPMMFNVTPLSWGSR